MEHITQLLERVGQGEADAPDALLAQVYEELRTMARRQLAREPDACTLVPTSLVHEAWLRLGLDRSRWDDRAHFFGAAAQAMRRICVEHARQRKAARRGGDWVREELTVNLADQALGADALLSLDQAIDRLSQLDERAARIVLLRYFGGFSVADCARLLGVAERSVYRDWAAAKAWLGAAID